MPALLATCTKCGYRFTFDYQFKQNRCSKCYMHFDWKENPVQGDSFHAETGGTSTSAVDSGASGPILPGEAGHEEYARSSREGHRKTIVASNKPEDI